MAVLVLYGYTGFDKPIAFQVDVERTTEDVKRATEGIEDSAAFSAMHERHGWWMPPSHGDPSAVCESFLAMYQNAPKLAVWAANDWPETCGDTIGKTPAG